MRRYWIERSFAVGDEVVVDGDLFHHIFGVCKQSVGDCFELLSSQSQAFLAKVEDVNKKCATVRIIEQRKLDALPKPYIKLCLSVPKFNTFEKVLEKSVELGVHTVQPLFSEYSFVRSAMKISAQKIERWQKIIKGATQQSGRGNLMELAKPLKLAEFLESFNRKTKVLGLFLYEGDAVLTVKKLFHAQQMVGVEEVYLFVGSEGGFSQHEVESFRSVGLEPLTMGAQVLRVETACVALISVLKYELNLLG